MEREAVCSFVAISDTHSGHEALGKLPDADVLLHAGDFTRMGRVHEVERFVRWLIEDQAHIPQKIVIPGNHELSLAGMASPADREAAMDVLTNAEARAAGIELLLGTTTTTRVGGFQIFGSPVQPVFWGGFMLPEDKIGTEWAKIPAGCDVLMTHGPAHGHGDTVYSSGHVGCPLLRQEVLARVVPAVCIAGHIHEGRGHSTEGGVTFLNVSSCNIARRIVHPPVVFSLQRGGPVAAATHDGRCSSALPAVAAEEPAASSRSPSRPERAWFTLLSGY